MLARDAGQAGIGFPASSLPLSLVAGMWAKPGQALPVTGVQDDSMVMTGEQPTRAGAMQQQRTTRTACDDGSMTRQWHLSDVDGKTWRAVFVAIYRRPPQPLVTD